MYKKKLSKTNSILIWDSEGLPPMGAWKSFLWREFEESKKTDSLSIPSLVEVKADLLKKRYLSWVYSFGEKAIKGKSIIKHLELRPAFSYWWMTLLTEKCNWIKSVHINDAIRLIAFDEWASNQAIKHLVLATSNKPLAECIQSWCENHSVKFEWRKTAKPEVSLPWMRRIFNAAPHVLQSLVWLFVYLVDRWPLRGVGLKEWRQTDGRTTFFSYSALCAPDSAKDGHYNSGYWDHLPDILLNEQCKTNWLHLYVKDPLMPTSRHAARIFSDFNNSGKNQQVHVTLDTFLSVRVVIRTLKDWIRLLVIGKNLRKEMPAMQISTINLWPLFKEDWYKSIFGTVAINNLLYLNLFESALSVLPSQNKGVYLQENQGWEFGLIQAWKKAGHGNLVGAPHGTFRYWDLRFFFDPRSYKRKGSNNLPMPNKVAVSGEVAWDIYKKIGYPVADLIKVEALRFNYLKKIKNKRQRHEASKSHLVRILVLGDYVLSNNQRQMRMIELAVPLLPFNTKITVKPHPNCPIKAADYPNLTMHISMDPVGKLLEKSDIAYASALTTAAVDAYESGVPIISVLDPNILNLSPLRGCEGALYASNAEDLKDKFVSVVIGPKKIIRKKNFFWIDPQLPRWRKLLIEK